MTLLERTRALLEKSLAAGISLSQIATDSSGTVNYEWLKKFSAGRIEDPGVNRIESLHSYLSLLVEPEAPESGGSPDMELEQ